MRKGHHMFVGQQKWLWDFRPVFRGLCASKMMLLIQWLVFFSLLVSVNVSKFKEYTSNSYTDNSFMKTYSVSTIKNLPKNKCPINARIYPHVQPPAWTWTCTEWTIKKYLTAWAAGDTSSVIVRICNCLKYLVGYYIMCVPLLFALYLYLTTPTQ